MSRTITFRFQRLLRAVCAVSCGCFIGLGTFGQSTDAPLISSVQPASGDVTTLNQITVTFNKSVLGVDSADLLINGDTAEAVRGSAATYIFTFPQPPTGLVLISWNPRSGITDTIGHSFQTDEPDASWTYNLLDLVPPTVAEIHPRPGLAVRSLSQVEVRFAEPVSGVTAASLLRNGHPAESVDGAANGPYIFHFSNVPNGTAQLEWAKDNQIVDLAPSPNRFPSGAAWTYFIDPMSARPRILINEFLAENLTGLRDEDGQPQDWIELYNPGDSSVDLTDWSLTDDPDEPGQWVFPPLQLPAKSFLILFASAKDRTTVIPGLRLHTNFKLNAQGEYLGLFNSEAPREVVDELSPSFPEQRPDYSYGRDSTGQWRYFSAPTAGGPNNANAITAMVEPVHFSVRRGYFRLPFNLNLSCPTPGATVRYTLDGSAPTATTGIPYTSPIPISISRMVRAAAFKANFLPSPVTTHTYLFNISASQRAIPALSLVTDPANLTGPAGIMGISGGAYGTDGKWKKVKPTDYYNPMNKGAAWERPVSLELIQPEDNGGFQIDCGIRVHASDYFRPRMHVGDKFSFNIYFRGDYGAGRLNYPFFPDSPVEEFNQLVLRAGSNDPTNPFVRDEFIRRLAADTGEVASHGTFVSLFINGRYIKYYNPVERIEERFLQIWHGGGHDWDVREQSGITLDGDAVAFNAMMTYANNHNLATRAYYDEFAKKLDLVNFIDYLLPLIYADTGDWPGNNWRAGREHTPAGKFRFYVWDAEWSFGYNTPVTHNTLTAQLADGSEIATIFKKLKANPEFRLLFADRVHKNFFNDGPLTDARLLQRYSLVKTNVQRAISGFNNSIATSWIPARRRYVLSHLDVAGLLASSNAPALAPAGGIVPKNALLSMTCTNGTIYYTTNGLDPRSPFTGEIAHDALVFDPQAPPILTQSVLVKARTRSSTNWSALTEAQFQIDEVGWPIRFSEIMFNPPGGQAFEFIELQNTTAYPVDVSGMRFEGIAFRFFESTPLLAPGAVALLASDVDPDAFRQRYPAAQPDGFFHGSLANEGERLALKSRSNQLITAVHFNHDRLWPQAAATAGGASLEILNPRGDPNDPANWRDSLDVGGSPGKPNAVAPAPRIELSEIMADNIAAVPIGNDFPDWLELHNATLAAVNVSGWSLTDNSDPRRFVVPAGTTIPADGYLVVLCTENAALPGLKTGFALSRRGETILLFDDKTNRVDAVTFGQQISDYSISRFGSEDAAWKLSQPTPGAKNTVAPVAGFNRLLISELMAHPIGDEPAWVELYNSDLTLPVDLRGLYVTSASGIFQIGALSFLGPQQYLQLFADSKSGPTHLDLNLSLSGGSFVMLDSTGAELQRINYQATSNGISQGTAPGGGWQLFAETPSPGAANYLPDKSGLRLNEILASADSVRAPSGAICGWIEIQNPTATALDLSNWSLSANSAQPNQWMFPSGAKIGPGAFAVVECDPNRPLSFSGQWNSGRALNPRSGAAYLFDASGRIVDSVQFGFQIVDQSIGRIGTNWALLKTPTAGRVNSTATGLGSRTNLRLNEWMAAGPSHEEWCELYNGDLLPVRLDGLILTDDPSLAGESKFPLAPLSFVSGKNWIVLETDKNVAAGSDHANFGLDDLGETIRLYDSAQLIDAIDFAAQAPGVSQGRWPDGSSSLVGFVGTPTPGAANVLNAAVDTDNDGIPDAWEAAHQLNALFSGDAGLDPDGDGLSNLQEFLAGTNPNDPQSKLELLWNVSPASLALRFQAAPGKAYRIEYCDSLDSDGWFRLAEFSARPQTEWMEAIDPQNPRRPARFYRLVLTNAP